jgi:predicted ATPase
VQAVEEARIALATEQGFTQDLVLGTFGQGWNLVQHGQGERGIAEMHQGLVALRAVGTELNRPYFLVLLAEAYGKIGQAEEGLKVLVEASDTVHKIGRLWCEAELYRLKGTLTLQSQGQGPKSKVEEEAEVYFRKAVEIARRQQAKSLELRAVMSLSRLWQQQGKKEEARQMLAEIYDWFTEGFDTKDLHEAKALLEELS